MVEHSTDVKAETPAERSALATVNAYMDAFDAFTRYRADGAMIGRYPSMWIVTREDGRWGIKASSSLAP